MKNKITMYELIGLIKDGKAPKNIKYNDEIFEYDKRYNYISQDGNLLFGDYIYELYYTPSTLNKIVEVSPEKHDEWEVIEELNYTLPSTHEKGKLINKDGNYNTLRKIDITILEKVNQLINNQKVLKERLDKNDNKRREGRLK